MIMKYLPIFITYANYLLFFYVLNDRLVKASVRLPRHEIYGSLRMSKILITLVAFLFVILVALNIVSDREHIAINIILSFMAIMVAYSLHLKIELWNHYRVLIKNRERGKYGDYYYNRRKNDYIQHVEVSWNDSNQTHFDAIYSIVEPEFRMRYEGIRTLLKNTTIGFILGAIIGELILS